MADLSKEKGQEPFPQWAFMGFDLHRNAGKAHQSLSGRNDQTIDNIQRTLRAYLEQDQLKGHKTLGNKLIPCIDPYQKFEGILSKAGFTGFYAFFLRPDCPREPTLSSTGPRPSPALFQA